MCVVIYVGYNCISREYFECILDEEGIIYKAENDYLGYKILIYSDDISKLVILIAEYIVEYIFRDEILSKIYDEYCYLDVDDACKAVKFLVEKISDSDIIKYIKNIILEHKTIHIENYILFNIKYIMSTIYNLVDNICFELASAKERSAFLALIRTYAKLSNQHATKADVEFTSDLFCNVTIDNRHTTEVECENLISFLTEKAPLEVVIKGEENSPFLSEIIGEIFNI